MKDQCPVLGCMERKPSGYVTCPGCWRCVPWHLKHEFNAQPTAEKAWKCIEYVGAWKSPLLPEAA